MSDWQTFRPRRLRQTPGLRDMLQRVTLRRRDVIVPIFVREGAGIRAEVSSMPGVFQMSIDTAIPWLQDRANEGFKAFLVFGVVDRAKKDATGSPALDPDNVVCRLLAEARRQEVPMVGITDLCFCEYTSHGHCGLLTEDDATVQGEPQKPIRVL